MRLNPIELIILRLPKNIREIVHSWNCYHITSGPGGASISCTLVRGMLFHDKFIMWTKNVISLKFIWNEFN